MQQNGFFPNKPEQVWQITVRHMCAGFVVDAKGKVIAAAPILAKWIYKCDLARIKRHCYRNNWKLEQVT